jgi:hypothetical protein
MSLSGYIERSKKAVPIYKEIYRKKALTVSRHESRVRFDFSYGGLSKIGQEFLEIATSMGTAGVVDCFCSINFFSEGPKIFRPSVEQCQAMENVSATLSLEHYEQPFPTMAIELPKDYYERKTAEGISPEGNYRTVAQPIGCILTFLRDVPALYVTTIWSNYLSISRVFHHFAGKATLEDVIVSGKKLDNSGEISPEEEAVVSQVLRIGINSMILLTHYGCKSEGPANPSLYERQERYVKVAKKKGDPDRLEQARIELSSHPFLYGFKQEVTLHESHGKTEGEFTGKHVRPHWRRGHYRMQPHGPAMSLRKLLYIKPVLVHSDQVADVSNTTTIYNER